MKKNTSIVNMMLKVLILEDSLPDMELMVAQLSKVGFQLDVTHASNKNQFTEALKKSCYDIILADFKLPGFDAFGALEISQGICPDVPFICVSGSIGEELAIDLLKKGAVDYVLKDRPDRLPFAIKNALSESIEKAARIETAKKLLESERKFRNLFFNHAAVKLIINPENGNIVEANKAACEFFGWPLETLQKMSMYQINTLPPEDLRKVYEKVKAHKRNYFEMTYRIATGDLIDVEVFSSYILDEDKEYLHSIIHDISEKRKAEEKLKLLNRAVEASSVSVLITDAEGRINYVNPYFTKLTGYSYEEVLGKNPRFMKSENQSKAFYSDLWTTILSRNDWTGEIMNKKKNGEIYWENVVISPIVNSKGDIINFVAIKDDITDKKKIQAELIAAKEKAEESDKLKTSFLHNISHEIRTPLNAIIGFSEVLAEPFLESEKRHHFSSIVVQSSNQLLSIITDIINISTIEAGQEKLLLKNINVNSKCKLIYEMFAQKAANKHISFQLNTPLADSDVNIMLDETKFTQVLTNLLDNALKFIKEGHVYYGYNLKNNFLEFYVEDTGIGIHPNMHYEIFKRFRQVEDSSDHFYGGSGLGLSISKAYVELHGGEIWINSEPGKGSAFYFTIPYRKELQDSISDNQIVKEITIENTNPITLLIAEDEDFNFMLLEELLSGPNFKIIRAINGIEAVEICKSNKDIDLVLMDIKMPLMDGYEATKQIRQFNTVLSIIAQTAYSTEADKNKALTAGCNDFLSKPFKQGHLISKIMEQIADK